MEVKLEGDFYFFQCPNCNGDIIVEKNELNCKIFRHGIYKKNFTAVYFRMGHNIFNLII